MSDKETTVEVAVYGCGPYDTVIHKVRIAERNDDTLRYNLERLRAMWKMIEEDLAKRGLV